MSTNIQDLPDDILVMACRRGEENAAHILFGRYQGSIQGYIGNVLRSHGCARLDHVEDVLQETWKKVLENLEQVAQTFVGWLFRIARNTAFDHLRYGCIRQQTTEQPLEELLLKHRRVSSVHEVVEARLLAEKLLVFAYGISNTFGQIVRLREIVGLDFVEIAADLGMTKDQVKNTYYRKLPLLKAEAKRLRIKRFDLQDKEKGNRYEELQ